MEPKPKYTVPEWDPLEELDLNQEQAAEPSPKRHWGIRIILILTALIFASSLILPNLSFFRSQRLVAPANPIYTKKNASIPINPDTEMLVSPTEETLLLYDNKSDFIQIFSLPNVNRITTINTGTGPVIKTDYAYNGQYIAVASENGDVSVFSPYTGMKQIDLPSDSKPINIAWSPTELTLAILYKNNKLLIWKVAESTSYPIENHDSGYLSWSPNGKYLAVSKYYPMSQGQAHDARLYDVQKASPLSLPHQEQGLVNLAIFFTNTDKILYALHHSDLVYFWDFSPAEPFQMPIVANSYWHLGLSPNEAYLYVMEADNMSIRVWDLAKQALQSQIEPQDKLFWTLGWAPDSSQLAFAYQDRVDIYQLNNARVSQSIHLHDDRKDLYQGFMPNKPFLLSHDGESLFFWDLQSGMAFYKLPAPGKNPGLKWLGDGNLLIISREDLIDIYQFTESLNDPNIIQSKHENKPLGNLKTKKAAILPLS